MAPAWTRSAPPAAGPWTAPRPAAPAPQPSPRCMRVVDARSCRDLLHDGDVDAVVRKAIALGLDPVRAVQLATINPATYFGLRDLGAVAPGYRANLIVCDDLQHFTVRQVYYEGRLVAEDGRALFEAKVPPPEGLTGT